jgi:hypothetical protein
VQPTVIASASEAIHGQQESKSGLLRRFTPRNDVEICVRDLAARFRASFALNLPPAEPQRAQGMPGAWRARSLVCEIKKHTSIVTTVTPETPGIPRAMVLTVSFALSPVIGLSCHRRLRNHFRRLDAGVEASGPHDFAVHLKRLRR